MNKIEIHEEVLEEHIKNNNLIGFKISFDAIKKIIDVNNHHLIPSLASLTVIENKLPFFKFLLENTNHQANHNNNDAIRIAAANGHLDFFKFLTTIENVDFHDNENHALRWAVINRYPEIVKLILKNEFLVLTPRFIESINCCLDIEEMELFNVQISLLLWNDSRVKEYLRVNDIILFEILDKKSIHEKMKAF